MPHFTGSCLCGSVTYEADGDIAMAFNCHCENCRKLTGSVFGTSLFMKEDSVTVSGETKTFDHDADSGSKMTRHFCPTCGSQIAGTNSARPGVIGLRAGTVNDLDVVQPQANIYCSSALPSTSMDDDLKTFDKMPG